MTDLRNLTIIGMIGRLNMLIDEGQATPTPEEVKRRIVDGSILDCLCDLYGECGEEESRGTGFDRPVLHWYDLIGSARQGERQEVSWQRMTLEIGDNGCSACS